MRLFPILLTVCDDDSQFENNFKYSVVDAETNIMIIEPILLAFDFCSPLIRIEHRTRRNIFIIQVLVFRNWKKILPLAYYNCYRFIWNILVSIYRLPRKVLIMITHHQYIDNFMKYNQQAGLRTVRKFWHLRKKIFRQGQIKSQKRL